MSLTRSVNTENLTPGMMLWAWSREARKQQGGFRNLQEGPEGTWQAMVVANTVAEPREIDGFGYPPVHRIDAFFWNDNDRCCFHSFYWTAGTHVQVIG